MTPPHDIPLTTDGAWSDGSVWVRVRSGPTVKAHTRDVQVSVWHRVRDLDGFAGVRMRSVCGYGPRDGIMWPSGGSRLEVARPMTWGTLPGRVCERCRVQPALAGSEVESVIPDAPDLDDLADLVARRLVERADERRAEQEPR